MGSGRNSKTRTALRAVIFVLIAVLGIGLISPAFVVNNELDMRHVHGFFLEPEDSLDVVLIGASQLYTGYSAPLAWRDYGFTSYPLAVSAAQGTMYPSMLREAAKKNKNVGIIDWHGYSEGHSEYLNDDGIHPNMTGAYAYATMIRQAVCGQ